MPEQPQGLMQLLPLIVFMVVMFLMFYYIIIMPAKRRQKSHQDLVAALKEGDEIVTAGGIHGRIVKVRDESAEVEVAEGVRLRFDRRAIRRKAGDREL